MEEEVVILDNFNSYAPHIQEEIKTIVKKVARK